MTEISSGATSQPTRHACEERRRLEEVYIDAIRNLNKLVEAQAESLIAGKGKLDRFDMAITVARERREQAMLAYRAHLESHRCLTAD
jgi:hypothetical protein